MEKMMSFGELKRYYEGRSPQRILFCTDNQTWDRIENPLKVNLTFTSMMMCCNPNAICLKNGDNFLCFEKVKRAHVDTERSPLGVVLSVVCGDARCDDNDIRYTLITT